jgi:hypothetical protein
MPLSLTGWEGGRKGGGVRKPAYVSSDAGRASTYTGFKVEQGTCPLAFCAKGFFIGLGISLKMPDHPAPLVREKGKL